MTAFSSSSNRSPSGHRYMSSAAKRSFEEASRSSRAPRLLDSGPYEDSFSSNLRGFLSGQRRKVGRLIAGDVRILDVGAIPSPAARQKVLQKILEIAQNRLSCLDVVVPCGTDGVMLLFDKGRADQAAAITDAIAEEVSTWFYDQRAFRNMSVLAQSFDLETYADLEMVDTLDDLTQAAQAAFKAFALERRSKSVLSYSHRACFAPMINPKRRLMVGFTVGLSLRGDGPPALIPSLEDVRCLTLDRVAEQAAAKIDLLGQVLLKTAPCPNVLFFVSIPGGALKAPLALRNLQHEIALLPAEARRRLVLSLDVRGMRDADLVLEKAPRLLGNSARAMVAHTAPDPQLVPHIAASSYIGLQVDAGCLETTSPVLDVARGCGLRTVCFDEHGTGRASNLLSADLDYVGGVDLIPPIAEPKATVLLRSKGSGGGNTTKSAETVH